MSLPALIIPSIIAIGAFVVGCPTVFAKDPTGVAVAQTSSTFREIAQYQFAWHPKHGSRYRIRLKDSEWHPWIPVSSSEIAALAAIFKGRAYIHSNGAITTGEEPVTD